MKGSFTKAFFILSIFVLGTPVLSKSDDDHTSSLQVVPSVDLSRYAGDWYEIARLPNKFQKDCAGEVVATYSQMGQAQLKVVNRCRRQNGEIDQAEGKARLAEKNGPNSKLEVRFAPAWLSWLPSVWGDYWIIALAPDYSYSVVGSPDRKYLWILSRTPQMEESLYKQLVEKAAASGFNVAQLVRTRQNS